MSVEQYRQMGKDLSTYLQRPLLVLVDKDGGVLYDTINLPKGSVGPVPTPTIAPMDSYIQPAGTETPDTPAPAPLNLFSVREWPGFAEALQKTTQMGIFNYGEQYYLAVCSPVLNKKKVVGSILLGIKLNGDVLERLKAITQNEVAFYANNKIQLSTFPEAASSDVNKTAFAPRHSSVNVNNQNFLWDDVPVNDLDQVIGGHFFIYQPIRESITLEGSFLKTLATLSAAFIFLVLILGLWYVVDLLSPLRQIIQKVNLMKEGQLNTPLPIHRQDDWGDLARSIHELILSIKDKERVSMVLGKVVSPLAAQKILAEKNYFALKGERRECTLMEVQIKGFNALSQNMTPEVLVEVLNQYLSLINESVFKYEGMVDKFVGGTAIAVWGAPFVHEDKEIRAVKAALAIQKRVQEINITRIQNGHTAFSLSIGIHTGVVVSGNLGSDQYYDYSIIGEPLDTVSQLCTIAAPDQILLTQETYDKIKDLAQFIPARPLLIPSRKEPLATYELSKLL
jgi:class 3 adenylate cyclase